MLRFAVTGGKFQPHLKSTFRAPKQSRPLFNNHQKRNINSSPVVRDTHYEVLGVESSAKPAKISEAYRKKAMEWHPDRNKAANAKERFLLVQQAYSVLKDKKKRQEYDKLLEDVSNGAIYTKKPAGARVVRRRAPVSFIFIGIIFLVSLWYKWDTFVPGTEDQTYLHNPREYYQAKQNKETDD